MPTKLGLIIFIRGVHLLIINVIGTGWTTVLGGVFGVWIGGQIGGVLLVCLLGFVGLLGRVG